MRRDTVPLTVIGGYLGAGKTTLLNALLRDPGGRRIGVIVNDFGSLAIDAGWLADAGAGDVISLPNGCVCCSVGAGLHEALTAIMDRPDPPDHVVIEASGVADPSVVAAWGTITPFEPGGVIVLADATSVLRRAVDRYVGAEVTRQLRGVDLVVVTKSDLCDEQQVIEVEEWVSTTSGDAPSIRVVDGRIPAEVVLGIRADRELPMISDSPVDIADGDAHGERYVTWSWSSDAPMRRQALDSFLAALPAELLRLKGRVRLDGDAWVTVQVVGRRVDVVACAPAARSELVAVALRADPPIPPPFALHFG